MRIVIIRHGQTQVNILNEEQSKIFFGGALEFEYSKLTEKGIEQAKKLTNLDIIKEIETVYCSDLSRAIQTAKIAKPNSELNIDVRLRERSLGNFEGYSEDILTEKKEYNKYVTDEKYNHFRADFIQKAPNGENYSEVSKRVLNFLENLDFTQDKTIGIFAHYHVIRCLFLNMLKIEPKEKVIRLKINNCEPYVIEGNSLDNLRLISHNLENMYIDK